MTKHVVDKRVDVFDNIKEAFSHRSWDRDDRIRKKACLHVLVLERPELRNRLCLLCISSSRISDRVLCLGDASTSESSKLGSAQDLGNDSFRLRLGCWSRFR